MNKLNAIEEQAKKEVILKEYKGADRVILAQDKHAEILETKKFTPAFRAMTELPSLNECVEGFRKGQLVVLSGPPKQGKSSICQTFTKHFTAQGQKCLWLEYELTYDEFLQKFPMPNLDFYIPNYMETGNLEWVENRIIESIQKFNTEIVFIDHLDFLRDPDVLRGISLNLASYIGGIVQKVKRMAVENNVVIFLMSHIRKNEWTTNKLPSSEELRDSGQTAQLADIVMMIIRQRAGRDSNEIYDSNKAILGVVENRANGKTRKIPVQLINGEFKEVTENYGF